MSRAEPTVLLPEIVELVGRAALPIIQALDAPVAPEIVGETVRPSLEKLCMRTDLPRDLRAAADDALDATRRIEGGASEPYADLLRAMHRLLVESDLPAPRELAAE